MKTVMTALVLGAVATLSGHAIAQQKGSTTLTLDDTHLECLKANGITVAIYVKGTQLAAGQIGQYSEKAIFVKMYTPNNYLVYNMFYKSSVDAIYDIGSSANSGRCVPAGAAP